MKGVVEPHIVREDEEIEVHNMALNQATDGEKLSQKLDTPIGTNTEGRFDSLNRCQSVSGRTDPADPSGY